MKWSILIIFASSVISAAAYFYFSPPSPQEILVGPLNTPCDPGCWQERQGKFDALLSERGLAAVFKTIEELYATSADFRRWCNVSALRLGELAYQKFPNPAVLPLEPAVLFCNHGFIYGYAEKLLSETGDTNQAKIFCDIVGARFSAQNPGVSQACYYGMGRGAMNLTADVSKNGVEVMINKASRICEAISQDEALRDSCVSGMFNRLGKFYTEGTHGLRIDKRDPLWFCHGEQELHRLSCYGNTHRVLSALLPEDRRDSFREAVKLYRRLYGEKNDAVVSRAANSLAYEQAQSKVMRGNHAVSIKACRELEHPSFLSCLQGFAVGLAKNGRPGYQYREVIDFCKDAAWSSPPDYLNCLQLSLGYLKIVYPSSKFLRICENIRFSLSRDFANRVCL